jgi:matrixin
MFGEQVRRRLFRTSPRPRGFRPRLEGLEDRFLLYATTGTQWAKPKMISYSFVPDGTSIGGVPSNLRATLNAHFATSDWQAQFAKAATVWQKVANVNFSLLSDNGAALGVSGKQQMDSRFGDIRIGGYAMDPSILAYAYLAPPANGGTDAGDIFFNTAQSWQINGTTYDLMTVAIHEFGHALGMGHSTDSTAAMYPAYTATKEAVNTDDTSGIRSIYNSRQNDFFDANGANDVSSVADDISSYIDGNGQLTLSALDSTTPVMIGQGDLDWYKITVPSTTTGTMVVKMQSTNLSLLAPGLAVYNGAGTTILGQKNSTAMGDTVSVTINGVSAGQVYDIRCRGTTTGDSGFGAYGLQVNFGSATQPPVTAPNTVMDEAADQGGGTLSETNADDANASSLPQDVSVIAGVPNYWVYNDSGSTVSEDNGLVNAADNSDPLSDPSNADLLATDIAPSPDSTVPDDAQVITVGNVSGLGDAMMINIGAERQLDSRAAGNLTPWAPLWRPQPPTTIFRPAFTSDQANQNVVTTLDFSSGDDHVKAVFPFITQPKIKKPERMQNEIVDRALDSSRIDPLM